jgi:predicted nucleic acid-binding Zn ribbon protein
MESLTDAIAKRMNSMGTLSPVTAAMILDAANRVLPETCTAKYLKGDVLTVEAESSAAAYFLKQDTETYLERLQAALPQSPIRELRIRTNHRKSAA